MTDKGAASAFEQLLVDADAGADGDRPGAPLDPSGGRALFTWVAWGLAAWGAIALVPIDGADVEAGILLVAAAAVLWAVVRAVPWRRLPAWLQTLPILATYPLLVAVNHLEGADVSLVAPLLAIPAAWFAFLGTRRQVALAVVATGATCFVPFLVGLDPATPAIWRSGIVLTLAVAVLGSVANRATATARANRRRADELAPSHEQLEAILRSATDHAIVGVDLFGTVTSFNVGAERMFGMTADEVIGQMKAQDFHDPAELRAKADVLGVSDPGLALVHDVLEGRSGSDEWTVTTKDGRRLLIHLGITGIHDDDGQLTGFIGIARDLTSERRMADRYATLIESLPELMVLVAGPDLVVTAASGRLFADDGIPLDLMVGHHVREIADTCEPPVTSSFERACLGHHEAFECTGVTGREYRGEIVPVLGTDGEVEELICALRDVTAERSTLRALERSEQLHRLILSSLREGVVYFDRGGRVIEANAAARKLFGVDEGFELMADRDEDLPVEDADGRQLSLADSPLPRAIATGLPQVDQAIVLRRSNGRRAWLNVNAMPVAGDDGVDGVVVSVSDETERRQAEQEVALSRDHFGALIEHSHDMILVLDDRTSVTYASPAWKQVLGWDDIGVRITADPTSLVHPDDADAVVRSYLDVGRQPGATETVRYRFRHRDGGWRTLEGTLTNLRDDPAVRGTVINARDITPQVEAASKLTHQALHDALTGLPNRVLVQDRIQRALDRQRRDGGHVAVLFLDLDRFKTVNDSLGHSVGDALLIEVSHRLDRSLRPGDTVGRLGGDEFIVIAEQLRDPEDALVLAQRLADALNEPLELAGQHLIVRASIGVVTTDGIDEPSPEDLLRDADAAMYKAKQGGRGRWEVFDDGLRRAAIDRLITEQELRTALSRREFVPFFQPQYDLLTGRLLGAEALVRWIHPQRGTLAPVAFLEVADSTGLLTAIGWQIFEQAFVQAQQWRRDVPDFVISVNLSIGQLSEPDFAARLQVLLERTGLDPSAVCLELTEYSLLELKGVAARELNRAKELGASIAVDDFGTGYSNLQLLANVRVDVLKIDRSFVDPLDQQDAERHHAVAAAIISLGHALGLAVVAEGVERVEHVDALLTLGCDEAQGYLFGRPVPPAEFVVGSCTMLAGRGTIDPTDELSAPRRSGEAGSGPEPAGVSA